MSPSWYLGLEPEQVGERCLLVGDPARVDAFCRLLDGARIVTERRGLRTATGTFRGARVTVSAFGMGAPIAVIVLEELVTLGVRVCLRVGTAMALSPSLPLGTLVVASGALRREGTSLTYAPPEYPASASPRLVDSCAAALRRAGAAYRTGLMASDDGFYSRLFPLTPDRAERVDRELDDLRRLGVLAVDMETSAVLTVSALLGAEAGALCLASVDAGTRERLGAARLEDAQRRLYTVALDAVSAAG
jgi:uridine phosphorylase